MHSRMGKSTIPYYIAYHESDLDNYKISKEEKLQRKLEMENLKKAQMLFSLGLMDDNASSVLDFEKIKEIYNKNI